MKFLLQTSARGHRQKVILKLHKACERRDLILQCAATLQFFAWAADMQRRVCCNAVF